MPLEELKKMADFLNLFAVYLIILSISQRLAISIIG
jgi:hypothetical protein